MNVSYPEIRRVLRSLVRSRTALGTIGAAHYWTARFCAFKRKSTCQLAVHGISHPITCRTHTSDFRVFSQVFVNREYAGAEQLRDVKLVLDCGANIGCASIYFLNTFPDCEVLAVEPDPESFELLERNLAPYGARASVVRAGVWSDNCGLVLTNQDAESWGRQVREAATGETAQVDGLGVGTLIKRTGHTQVSLLKVDIEGSEVELFSSNVESWINSVDAIVIEVHPGAERIVAMALTRHGFETSVTSPTTLATRRPKGTRTGGAP